jgi:DNA-directed RNA polymerase specialized sigma24 family protein
VTRQDSVEIDLTVLRALSEMDDPSERARRASQLVTEYQQVAAELSRIRREAIEELIRLGWTQREVAKLLGMTRARVGQLLSSGRRPQVSDPDTWGDES